MNASSNATLDKLRDIQEQRFQIEQDAAQRLRDALATRAELAAPLIAAFRDVQDQFANIRMMKQIWPEQFGRKIDRVSVFLAALIGPEEAPHGIVLYIPNGSLRFESVTFPNRPPDFVSTKEVFGQKSVVIEFPNHSKWFEYFLRVLSELVDL